jgi:nucleoside-diphosphate-sugar epimerase
MILITGATGLVGSHLLKELATTSADIIALYHNTKPSAAIEKLATWKQVDILDITALECAMQNVQQVYHCAAMVSFNPKEKAFIHQLNIEGTTNVVNACIHAGVKKLVHVSSVAALGKMSTSEMITEKMQWSEEANNSEYGKTKYLSEMEVWRGIGEGLHAVILNPSIILGAGDWNNGSTGIFKTAYNEFPWYTNGSNGFVDVEDVAKAMFLLMNSSIINERFIVSGWNLSYKKVFDTIAITFGKKQPHKKVTPLLAVIVWRVAQLKSFFTGAKPLLTKETAASAQINIAYDNSKLLKQFPQFKYASFEQSIERICGELKLN